MKKEALSIFKKMPGARLDWSGSMASIPLPDEDGGRSGLLTAVFPMPGILFYMIDIKSVTIPEALVQGGQGLEKLKINYCSCGRCELKLNNGEFTYLSGGEIAIDAGQAKDAFYYPNGEYKGFEVIIFMDGPWKEAIQILGKDFLIPDRIAGKCRQHERPQIMRADKRVAGIYEEAMQYIQSGAGTELVLVKVIELLMYLERMDVEDAFLKRTYCTSTQVEVAKRTRDILLSDLGKRHTAKELAQRFGISETSLKNYFRSVYGCGYAQYQRMVRMKKAGEMLRGTDAKVVDIAAAVGFATQAKFGVAFKSYYGVPPLEYRRGRKFCSE